jgi:hypothetical protein
MTMNDDNIINLKQWLEDDIAKMFEQEDAFHKAVHAAFDAGKAVEVEPGVYVLPCPLCGGEMEILKRGPRRREGETESWIQYDHCGFGIAS